MEIKKQYFSNIELRFGIALGVALEPFWAAWRPQLGAKFEMVAVLGAVKKRCEI